MFDVNDKQNKGIMDTLEEMMNPNKSSGSVPPEEPEPPELPEPPVEPYTQGKRSVYDGLDIDNPYREHSSVDLGDLKKYFRMIETPVLEKLIKYGLSGSEWSIFMYILDRTRGHMNKQGYYRHTDTISIQDYIDNTGLSKKTIYKNLKSLGDKHIIYEVEKGRSIMELPLFYRTQF